MRRKSTLDSNSPRSGARARGGADERRTRTEERGIRGGQRRARSDARGIRSDQPVGRSDERSARNGSRGPRADQGGARGNARNNRGGERSVRGNERGARNGSRGPRADERGARGNARNNRGGERSVRGAAGFTGGAGARGDRDLRNKARGPRVGERGAYNNERAKGGSERKVRSGERGIRGGERGIRGGERGVRGGERGVHGGEREVRGGEREVRGGEREARGGEREARGGYRGTRSDEGGPRGEHRAVRADSRGRTSSYVGRGERMGRRAGKSGPRSAIFGSGSGESAAPQGNAVERDGPNVGPGGGSDFPPSDVRGRGERGDEGERLQKVLSRAGLASRREVEDWIRAGRITVNGEPAVLGIRVGRHDHVRLDGRLIRQRQASGAARVFLIHRSPGENLQQPVEAAEQQASGESAESSEGSEASSGPRTPDQPSAMPILDRIPRRAGRRFIPVSPMPRVDGGLELVTSDGDLAAKLQRSMRGLTIEFSVRVHGELSPKGLETIVQGMLDNGEKLQIERCDAAGGEGSNRWYSLVARGASGKDVRQLFERQGALVSRVLRTQMGSLALDRHLSRGRFRELSSEELDALLATAEGGGAIPG